MAEVDNSKRFFNEFSKLRSNLIKETLEVLGDDYFETEANVKYHNYLDTSLSGVSVLGYDGDTDFGTDVSGILRLLDTGQFDNASLGALTVDKLLGIFKGAKRDYIGATLDALNKYGNKIGLSNKGKLFVLAQLAHESGDFRYIAESGHGKGHAYGLPSGPYGKRYYGRGPIQVTHETNYKYISQNIFPKLGINANIWANPEICEQDIKIACAASMAWFMLPGNNGKNAIAAANAGNVKALTKAINGGYNGLDDRIKKTHQILQLASNG